MVSTPGPERTCIACRRKAAQGDFYRIAKNKAGVLSLIPTGPSFSRSAYVCPTDECIERAFTKERLSHALRFRVSTDERNALFNELQCKHRKREV